MTTTCHLVVKNNTASSSEKSRPFHVTPPPHPRLWPYAANSREKQQGAPTLLRNPPVESRGRRQADPEDASGGFATVDRPCDPPEWGSRTGPRKCCVRGGAPAHHTDGKSEGRGHTVNDGAGASGHPSPDRQAALEPTLHFYCGPEFPISLGPLTRSGQQRGLFPGPGSHSNGFQALQFSYKPVLEMSVPTPGGSGHGHILFCLL